MQQRYLEAGIVSMTAAIMAVPSLSHAAAAGAILGPVVQLFVAFTALFQLGAVAGMAYLGWRCIMEVASNRDENRWIWYGFGSLVAGAIAFILIPAASTSTGASASTLSEVQQCLDLCLDLLP